MSSCPLSLFSHQQLTHFLLFLHCVWLCSPVLQLLALIGEQFTEAGDICGVAANARPNKDRVVLWTKTASNEAVQLSIGRQLKEISGISDKISYSSF
ncbi:unnamed protein product, partial [Closterium sp. NIES-53]